MARRPAVPRRRRLPAAAAAAAADAADAAPLSAVRRRRRRVAQSPVSRPLSFLYVKKKKNCWPRRRLAGSP